MGQIRVVSNEFQIGFLFYLPCNKKIFLSRNSFSFQCVLVFIKRPFNGTTLYCTANSATGKCSSVALGLLSLVIRKEDFQLARFNSVRYAKHSIRYFRPYTVYLV